MKIGVVDVAKAFEKYKKSAEANKGLREQIVNIQKQVNAKNRMVDENQQLIGKLNEDLLGENLDDEGRRKILEDIRMRTGYLQESRNAVQQAVQAGNDTINKFRNDSRMALLKDITDTLAKIGAEEKLDLIFDVSGRSTTNVSALVYHSGNAVDLTDKLVERLNQ
ncbi:MAG: OmpH family outer membrane protein [Planctomycetes bacterium]|nr:OmpH family outer membrane protein [Planctomycetota bacterium]